MLGFIVAMLELLAIHLYETCSLVVLKLLMTIWVNNLKSEWTEGQQNFGKGEYDGLTVYLCCPQK